ncbi:MAG: hypothetical protein D6790_03830 [Caldilineae bacterium]|nr:MAG: hypothetical protein D6790_03830 [Caldilineae bacterium]
MQKNPDIEVVVSDPSPAPAAVKQGVIERVDIVENVTPLNINQLARRIRPDLILISSSAEEHGLGALEGGQALTHALNYEIASHCDCPVLILSHSNAR